MWGVQACSDELPRPTGPAGCGGQQALSTPLTSSIPTVAWRVEPIGTTLRLMKMRSHRSAAVPAAVGVTLLLVSACTGSSTPTTARPASSASAPSSPTRVAEPLVRTSYGSWGFTAAHPVTWRSYPFEAMGTLGGTLGYLSTDVLHDPCTRTPSTISCDDSTVRLSPTGVLIRWVNVGSPSVRSINKFSGDVTAVDGSEARLQTTRPATGPCLSRGGTSEVQGTILRPNAAQNFLQMDACIGPHAGAAAGPSAEAVFRSVLFSARR